MKYIVFKHKHVVLSKLLKITYGVPMVVLWHCQNAHVFNNRVIEKKCS